VVPRASRIVLAGLPGEVLGVVRRHLAAALIPAAVLGAAADTLVLALHHVEAEIVLGVALAVAFELYVGYAELVVAADRNGGARPPLRLMLRRAAPAVPALTIASLVAVTLPLAATGLLVLPGLWLLTRWSLFAPAIVHERLTPARALGRSAELVRRAFWPVACSVTAMVVLEEVVIHAGVHAEATVGVPGVGLVAAAAAVALVSPPAALTVSLVYERLAGVDARAGLPLHTGAPPSVRGAPVAGSSR
jgi:hypothetical protein